MKDFPIPVVPFGPGSQAEDEALAYMPMPQGMATFQVPRLPEPELLASRAGAHRVLRETLAQLDRVQRGEARHLEVSLNGLDGADLALVNQVMGEGEVSALVRLDESGQELRVQESVFAGIWRVVRTQAGTVLADHVEIGPVPQVLQATGQADASPAMPRWDGALPPNVQNAPALLVELEDAWTRWQPGDAAKVVNLTLLPMSVEDIGFLDHHLGTGRVLILSRGYGNCRITNTLRPHCWRVVHYNSQDAVILNTVEVGALPEVAQAAPEDLRDSFGRLREVLQWVEGVHA